MNDIVFPAQKQLEAYNDRDIDAFMECYADNCVVEDSDGSVRYQGADKMRDNYRELFESSPNLHCKLLNRIARGRHVIDEEEVTGHRGSAQVKYAVAVYTIENGKIVRVRFLD